MPGIESNALQLLRKAVGDPGADFRGGQLEAILALVRDRKRLLIVERTGWGKSAVYFIGAKLLRLKGAGPTLIISPLLSLMRNQLLAAERMGVQAVTINSSNAHEHGTVINDVLNDDVDAILISPERLANQRFIDQVLLPIASRIGMLVVDEAHCISDWGHDFRPDYRRIISILRRLPTTMPVACTTATANDRVIRDLQAQVGDVEIQRGSLVRTSLRLDALRLPDQSERLAWLAHYIPKLPASGIIYALTTRDADKVAEWLRHKGISAEAYHAGISYGESRDGDRRVELENALLDGSLKVLVATSALGMGFDKPDLGFVIHFQAPASIVAYYQQVGRAGRAIDKAYGILLAGTEDEEIHTYFQTSAFPTPDNVAAVLEQIEGADGIAHWQLEQNLNLRTGQITKTLKFLSMVEPAPIIQDGLDWKRTAVPFALDTERIERLTEMRRAEWAQVQEYLTTDGCLMNALQHALDDQVDGPCGCCANCMGKHFPDHLPAPSTAEAAEFLKQAVFDLTCPVRVPPGTLTDLVEGGKILPQFRAEKGRILSRWGHAGYGALVRDQKHAGHLEEDLVQALADMITERWKPDPAPAWVTAVPSLNHPELVPELARRLAKLLDLPYRDVIVKVEHNQPQKLMQNRFHQCTNLEHAFRIDAPLLEGPVLLVDDVVDSGWTFALLAARLREAGSNMVYPVALASTAHT
ncbi:MAG: RecQ family ATP-dependent DNA helicase [Flavobacteriales bacterium]|nr:RecQ family ATP-dependent DNA helicase [Flavobacteriales bacterium]